jgi:hypothetical protein
MPIKKIESLPRKHFGCRKTTHAKPTGSGGACICQSASGAQCVKITAPTVMPGTIFRTIIRVATLRWGEDGLGGICDSHQFTCFALALWNGRDLIL